MRWDRCSGTGWALVDCWVFGVFFPSAYGKQLHLCTACDGGGVILFLCYSIKVSLSQPTNLFFHSPPHPLGEGGVSKQPRGAWLLAGFKPQQITVFLNMTLTD